MTDRTTDLLALSAAAFLDRLAAETPTPGGGAAAALAGALAAGLTSMVARYTLGRERFAAVAKPVSDLLARSEAIRAALMAGVEADAAAYAALAAAYKMPRGSDEERAARQAAIAQAARTAAEVPLDLAAQCVALLALAEQLAEIGNPQLVSDVGAATTLANGALHALLFNAEVNLPSVRDAVFAASVRERAAAYRAQAAAHRAATLERVRATMSA
jgi:formiminotetrahydrofolate cyclodeaminase